jgi:hypothetical protein
MDLPIILLIIGLLCVITSFFVRNSSNYDDELEKVSISLHQETNSLKKRLKAVEEELIFGIAPMPVNAKSTKPIHEIIVNQILSLHAQGYSIREIAKRASLTEAEVSTVLQSRGVLG